ncbi:hypothetical protein [Campylobacter geochelonis]|uniref:Membrane protein n=1 Tax=Campylobacter geochelonis TaxID=1780362 RepID=A0A128EHW2_9BACT|nr:hypothetical protein [Campylobacter geochelonis]QKF71517.1 putative membrane protein [Campylobacter geochelonis]CZE47926.1 membrane protein [Campylobacter geochelonis]CZE48470.1 membrane protein [Campylobacter geochelonis]CZE50799.1 membrane protein [Campylobacter geochelonis]
MKNKKLKDEIIDSMFIVSKKPVLFRDLLDANVAFNEGMLVDPAKLNFRFRYGRSYIVFGVICLVFLIPFIIITHSLFLKVDFHLSIIVSVLITALVFISFDLFKVWARKELTQRLIKSAWQVHFPYFAYEKYSQKVEEIYDEAVKKELPRRDLEQYVLDSLVKQD